jgi:hypothetical protein
VLDPRAAIDRRRFLLGGSAGLGGLALESLLRHAAAPATARAAGSGTDFAPKAKRAIWLFMAGGPSQLDLLDYKPGLADMFGAEVPASVLGTQRLSAMTSGQGVFRVAPSAFKFSQHGQAGTWFSELLPWTARLADDVAVIRTVNTEAVNHDPAMSAAMTGSQLTGKPAVGAWLSYGLGSLNQNLPTFVVMTSLFSQHVLVQALSNRLWDSAFLPSIHAGVTVRGTGDPILFIKDPGGMDTAARRAMLDATQALNALEAKRRGDPATQARIDEYELAFRMQSAVPELTDLGGETATTRALYGDSVNTPGSFAANCLLARRMLERDVRFVQILAGTPIRRFRPSCPRNASTSIRPATASSPTSSSAACWTTPWSSGAGSSAGPYFRKARSPPPTTDAITTRAASRCGSRAAA